MSAVSKLLQRRRKAVHGQPAQAWYNDLLGGVHWVGDKALRVFGQGNLSDSIAKGAGDAIPEWSLTDEQKKAREAEAAAQQKQELAAKQQQEAEAQKRAELEARKAALQAQLADNEKKSQELLAQIRESQQRTRDELDRLAKEHAESPAHS